MKYYMLNEEEDWIEISEQDYEYAIFYGLPVKTEKEVQ